MNALKAISYSFFNQNLIRSIQSCLKGTKKSPSPDFFQASYQKMVIPKHGPGLFEPKARTPDKIY
ncbi:hypothetical protein BpHYR1_007282 [Brachionus plicatilis]|uniref:Uncharacterized protein n=1 Tax=Brachionus plicatilis TaxID=10195 RepID=A0A3M7Q3Z5_BRAPC|nr:hypothetical protein BpHYR1_007282 [Brachionus plicatilis]